MYVGRYLYSTLGPKYLGSNVIHIYAFIGTYYIFIETLNIYASGKILLVPKVSYLSFYGGVG
jgi:hypothetical protein